MRQMEPSAPAMTEADFGIGRLFPKVPDAVIVGDAATGRIVVWNPAAAEMFGYAHEEGPGLSIHELVPSRAREAHLEGMRRLAAGEPTPLVDSESVVELEARRKDGTTLWVEMRLAHVEANRPGQFALAILRDVSVRRAAAEAQHALRLELEDRNRELERVSRTDYLTGLWNRRHVDEHLAKAISASSRHGRPVAVVLLDVDHFKDINSSRGYQTGDAVLVGVAERLSTQVRVEDTFGRWGGEEFLLVLPDADLELAVAAAERLRTEVASRPFATETGDIAVTISGGVASAVAPDRDSLLRAADAALRRAKADGRDRVAT